MSDEPEHNGFYWVRFDGGDWVVAEWFDGHWWTTGSEVEKGADRYYEWEGPLVREC